tara:strand:+ start:525 stop:1721 length:1197 start_codon:yes stop_codon:yes gene_type:complete
MQQQSLAQTALLSSLITLFVIGGLLFTFKDQLVSYLIAPQSGVIANVDSDQTTQEQALIKMIEEVNPAVVSVIVTKDIPVYERYYETVNPWGLYGGFTVPRVRENGTERQEVGGGSGFIVSNDGLIVTNRHVVDDPDASYTVLLNDGTAYDVEVLALDPLFDIAILQISSDLQESLTFVRFGDSEDLALGQTVVAIGNALAEFRNSVSVGVVSGLARSIVASDNLGQSESLDQVIQTDAAINPGNSGGPLLNRSGEVVGVNVAVSSDAENIGFALPSNVVKGVVDSVREHGRIIRPFLGVQYVMLNEHLAERYETSVSYGALVVADGRLGDRAVALDSPAEEAGITEGTIILSVDGLELFDRDLASVLRSKQVGQTVELVILQDGVEKEIFVLLDQAL